MSRTLDALRRHNHEVSSGPDLTSRRSRPDDAVLASLGYSTGGSKGPGRGGQILRIALGTVVVAVAALLLWQIGASSRLLPNPPWNAARGFRGTPAQVSGPSAVPSARREPPVETARRSEVLPAQHGSEPAGSGAAADSTQASARSVKPAEASAQQSSVVATKQPGAGAGTGGETMRPSANALSVATPKPVTSAPNAGATPKPASAPSSPGAHEPVASRSTEKPAISRTPPGETDHFRLALYYQRIGDFENALVQYRRVLEANELNPEAHNNLGLLYQDKGLFEEAIQEFRRAIFIDPNYMTAHNNLGVALLKSGKVDAAISEFKWIASVESRNIEVLTNLALAQKTNGRTEEARETLQRVLTIDNKYPVAHYNLALILEESGELTRAIEHYEKFLASAGAEHASLTGEVRARVQILRTKIGR